MNYKDVALMDQSFKELGDTLLRNRMMDQQKEERNREFGLQEREQADREKLQSWEMDAKNPANRERGAQASIYEDQVKKLGIKEMETSWTTADGREVKLKGTAQDIQQAMQDAPPSPQTKVKSSFVTKDGVAHTIEGTPEQLKAQQASLSAAGGGIQPTQAGLQTFQDADGNTRQALVNPKTGAIHILNFKDTGEVELTEGTRDPVTGEVHEKKTRMPIRKGSPGKTDTNAPAGPAGDGKPITDKQGRKWNYLGKAKDPTTDKDPKNWQRVDG